MKDLQGKVIDGFRFELVGYTTAIAPIFVAYKDEHLYGVTVTEAIQPEDGYGDERPRYEGYVCHSAEGEIVRNKVYRDDDLDDLITEVIDEALDEHQRHIESEPLIEKDHAEENLLETINDNDGREEPVEELTEEMVQGLLTEAGAAGDGAQIYACFVWLGQMGNVKHWHYTEAKRLWG